MSISWQITSLVRTKHSYSETNLGISQGTIIHFCQNQGFSGYKEFKEVLATLPQEFIDEPLQPDFGP